MRIILYISIFWIYGCNNLIKSNRISKKNPITENGVESNFSGKKINVISFSKDMIETVDKNLITIDSIIYSAKIKMKNNGEIIYFYSKTRGEFFVCIYNITDKCIWETGENNVSYAVENNNNSFRLVTKDSFPSFGYINEYYSTLSLNTKKEFTFKQLIKQPCKIRE